MLTATWAEIDWNALLGEIGRAAEITATEVAPEAWRELRRRLLSITCSWRIHPEDAEDMVSDVIARLVAPKSELLERLNNLRNADALKSYLMVTMRNEVRCQFRSRLREASRIHQVALARVESPPESETPTQIESIDLFDQILRKLFRSERDLFILKYKSEHSLREIATLTNQKYSTIATRLRRLNIRIKNNLQKWCGLTFVVVSDDREHSVKSAASIDSGWPSLGASSVMAKPLESPEGGPNGE